MPYCSQGQLVTRFGVAELIQLTDHDGLSQVDVTVLAAAQDAADSDINKRLRTKGWVVPLTVPSADIVAIALDITRFYLYTEQTVDVVAEAYKRRIKELDDYVAGRLVLDIGLPDVLATSAGDVDYVQSDRVFSADSLTGF